MNNFRKKIGLIGYGTLGSSLYSRIIKDDELEVAFVYDEEKAKLSNLPMELMLESIEQIGNRHVDLVVEVAGSEWVSRYAALVLQHTDLLIASVVAFAEQGLKERLDIAAASHRTRYYISHGAILGLDGIRDGRAIISDVKVTTIRPPEGYDRLAISEPLSRRTVLYEGPVREACKRFPKNVNLCATVALYGLGFDQTRCAVIADPEIDDMKHLIEVRGAGLAWNIEVQALRWGQEKKVYVYESFFQIIKSLCSSKYGMVLT